MPSRNYETYQRLLTSAELVEDITSEKSKQAMLEIYTPDFEIVEPPSFPEGYGGTHSGTDAWLAMQDVMRRHWKQKMMVEQVWDLPDDDLIILYSMMDWTANATGKSIYFPTVELLWFRDGLLAKVEMFFQDTKAILETLEPG